MTHIVLLKSTWDNVGDGFVKIGAEFSLRSIFPRATIMTISELGAQKYKYFRSDRRNESFPTLLDYLDGRVDMVVLAGCVLKPGLIRLAEKLNTLRIRPTIVMLGAGGREYGADEVRGVGKALAALRPDILLSRDIQSYELYSKYFERAQPWIDCAFYVSDAVPRMLSRSAMVVRTFDRTSDPVRYSQDYFYITHMRFHLRAQALTRTAWFKIKNFGPNARFRDRTRRFQSDCLEEYLHLYSQASEVHTDLVHATVACIAYGTPVMLYARNPRVKLIEEVVGNSVLLGVSTVDQDWLNELKKRKLVEASAQLGQLVGSGSIVPSLRTDQARHPEQAPEGGLG